MIYKPLISIITVCYNSEKTIRQTIESVLNQTYSNIEYILVDGNSTDCTVNIIKEYQQKFQDKSITYRWISEKDQGIADAMNKGIKMAIGEWIGIINSDDWYELDACEKMFNDPDTKNYDIVYGLIRFINSDGNINAIEQKMFSELVKQPINHPGVFVKRKLHTDVGLYSLDYKIASDYDFLLKCRLASKSAKSIFCVVANFRCIGVSSNKSSAHISSLEACQVRYRNKVISRKVLIINGYLKSALIYLKVRLVDKLFNS